jgi:hypothetical protein
MFIAFAVLGSFIAAFATARWRKLIWLHLPAALWALYVEWTGKICPLTPLENSLRAKAGQAGYEGGFVEHYVLPIIYPEALTRDTQMILGVVVLAINVIGYATYFARRNKERSLLTSPQTKLVKA